MELTNGIGFRDVFRTTKNARIGPFPDHSFQDIQIKNLIPFLQRRCIEFRTSYKRWGVLSFILTYPPQTYTFNHIVDGQKYMLFYYQI